VPEASSSSELVYRLMDKEKVTAQVAEAIYMGIAHDTGVFQYSCTSPETLRIAADLISYGFDFSSLIAKTFYEKSYNQNRILGQALLNSRLFLDGMVIGTVLTKQEMKEFHIHPGQLDGIVSKLRETRGVDCSILIYPLENGENKVSLRSQSVTNVAKIAELYGGGGHIRAAGCNMTGDEEENLLRLVQDAEVQLLQAGVISRKGSEND
ncbi:MAG: bifunctional oligoribonuclease/PAP phosphatase NrnA, partial [Lachnospiraceae bacterium]|nr:bifunctional oligoribonuclease/PAP phosphatase NrnA [Lachnospiraceae bacterium]